MQTIGTLSPSKESISVTWKRDKEAKRHMKVLLAVFCMSLHINPTFSFQTGIKIMDNFDCRCE